MNYKFLKKKLIYYKLWKKYYISYDNVKMNSNINTDFVFHFKIRFRGSIYYRVPQNIYLRKNDI